MLLLNSCLCVDLETGGLIIGWLYFVFYILAIIVCAILVILACIWTCKDFEEEMGKDFMELCNAFHGIIIGILVVCILFWIGFTVISWICIQGSKTRNHAKVRPMMILLAILTVLSVLQIFNFTVSAVLSGLVEAAVHGYCFVVIYSLYERYRREAETGVRNNVQYQVGGYPVLGKV